MDRGLPISFRDKDLSLPGCEENILSVVPEQSPSATEPRKKKFESQQLSIFQLSKSAKTEASSADPPPQAAENCLSDAFSQVIPNAKGSDEDSKRSSQYTLNHHVIDNDNLSLKNIAIHIENKSSRLFLDAGKSKCSSKLQPMSEQKITYLSSKDQAQNSSSKADIDQLNLSSAPSDSSNPAKMDLNGFATAADKSPLDKSLRASKRSQSLKENSKLYDFGASNFLQAPAGSSSNFKSEHNYSLTNSNTLDENGSRLLPSERLGRQRHSSGQADASPLATGQQVNSTWEFERNSMNLEGLDADRLVSVDPGPRPEEDKLRRSSFLKNKSPLALNTASAVGNR